MTLIDQGATRRPLLLLDVDGVLSLWGFDVSPAEPASGLVPANVDGHPHFLSVAVARRIRRLAATFECAWCTGWEDRADSHLPHLLGLPAGWPHLVFGDGPAGAGRHWKLDAIEAFAGDERPVAWVDDQHDPSCETWVAARTGPTLLVATDPAVGLTDEDVEQLERWARDVTRAPAGPAPAPAGRPDYPPPG